MHNWLPASRIVSSSVVALCQHAALYEYTAQVWVQDSTPLTHCLACVGAGRQMFVLDTYSDMTDKTQNYILLVLVCIIVLSTALIFHLLTIAFVFRIVMRLLAGEWTLVSDSYCGFFQAQPLVCPSLPCPLASSVPLLSTPSRFQCKGFGSLLFSLTLITLLGIHPCRSCCPSNCSLFSAFSLLFCLWLDCD